jgi:hypothetical protein
MVKPPKLLLIGWDAADWATINPLLEAGELPHLQQLMDGGAHGPLSTLSPVLSPMLWATIGTGQLADRHGIHGFTTVDSKTGLPRPYGSTDRTAALNHTSSTGSALIRLNRSMELRSPTSYPRQCEPKISRHCPQTASIHRATPNTCKIGSLAAVKSIVNLSAYSSQNLMK